MSGVVTDYYAAKAESQTNFVVLTLIIVTILTPIYLVNEVKKLFENCSYRSQGRQEYECNKLKILGYIVGIIYLIIVAIMQFQKYRKEKAFDDLIKEKKKTNDELKVIDDENEAFSKKVNIISIPFYIFLVIVAIFIAVSLAKGY